MRELPLVMPAVRVDAVWHRRMHARAPHHWLRRMLARSAQESFARSMQDASVAAVPSAPE
ncbi:MAG: hypothetical protein EOO27_02040 [Comamonadaceae bacterium]|nr:MAG: hypothetical protein EOO27_02040 [Comamonadaceae bacterium]